MGRRLDPSDWAKVLRGLLVGGGCLAALGLLQTRR
jgi:hypothetical protein